MVFFNVLNCVFFLLGDFSRITIIGWHIDTFLHCRVFFFFNLFSFAEIQIDLSNLKIQSQYCPICFSSDIKYIHNVPKHYHYPSSWFIPCSTGKPYDLNCSSPLPSPQPSATLLPSWCWSLLSTCCGLLWCHTKHHTVCMFKLLKKPEVSWLAIILLDLECATDKGLCGGRQAVRWM